MKHRLSILCATLILAATTLADDTKRADWPQFRGPKRDGLSSDTGLLKEWPKDGPPLEWKATGIGSGYSSVTVVGDRVYTLGNKGKMSHLFAMDRKDGKVLWSAEVGKEGGNLGCTPTVDGDRIYAVGQDGDLVCVKAENGDVVWRKHFKKDFGGEVGGWRYTESPLIDGDRLICTPGAKGAVVVALNKANGDVVWKCDAPLRDTKAGYSSVVIAEVGGVKLYVQLVSAGIIGVAARDGKFLFHYDKLGNNTANIPTSIVLDDHVFVVAGYGKGGALLKLEADGDKVTAKEVYYNGRLRNKHGGVVVIGDRVYGDEDDSGYPYCAEVKTGKVVWKKKDRGPGEKSAAVTYADGLLYFRYENGVMALVDAKANEYKEVSTFKIPVRGGPSWSHPVVVGGRLYLRENDTLLVYDVRQK